MSILFFIYRINLLCMLIMWNSFGKCMNYSSGSTSGAVPWRFLLSPFCLGKLWLCSLCLQFGGSSLSCDLLLIWKRWWFSVCSAFNLLLGRVQLPSSSLHANWKPSKPPQLCKIQFEKLQLWETKNLLYTLWSFFILGETTRIGKWPDTLKPYQRCSQAGKSLSSKTAVPFRNQK